MPQNSPKGPQREGPSNQLKFGWMAANDATDPMMTVTHVLAESAPQRPESPVPLIQRLPWDFRQSFPQPTPEAVETGVIREEDLAAENIQAIHDEHARTLLAVLHDLDTVREARRRGVDPSTGKPPRSPASRQRLQKRLENGLQILEQTWRSLIDSYQSTFGSEAADAFAKAIRARHAGIAVVAESRPQIPQTDPVMAMPAASLPSVQAPTPSHAARERAKRPAPHAVRGRSPRGIARLPVPKPLAEAVAAGRFGYDDEQRPIRPGPAEIRAITENHADKLIGLMRAAPRADHAETASNALSEEFRAAIAAYAEDFGADAAKRLEAFVRRQASLDESPTTFRR